ncbi:MAG: ammonia-forming cytochrome c nitrite reductase subunit c552 [Longimicrobiales bacterium]
MTRTPLLAVVVVAALLVVAALVLAVRRDGEPPGSARIELPAPTPRVQDGDIAFADFVGAETCGECHSAQYDAWRGSTHGRAGSLPPEPAQVIAGFDGRPIRFRDAVVYPQRRGGEYAFRVVRPDLTDVVLRVDGVVGGGHMIGGGTQGFVTRSADGTVRFLPFDFSRHAGVWFCNTVTRADKGWQPITDSMALADCADWPPARVLGTDPRFSNCQNCHGSQIELAFDTAADRYVTRIQSLGVNCESCHGPGRAHVSLARSGELAKATDPAIRTMHALDDDASLEVCFECHALKDALMPGFLPGRPLAEYYSLKLPLLGEAALHIDGRVKTFAYQEQHLYSDCYVSGSMTCVDCHEPHGQQYRDITHTPLEDRFSDQQCLACHAAKAANIPSHTKHAEGSAGSRCVACHMPYLQEQGIGHAIRYARSDHTISVPRPAYDEALGIESACAQCHADRSVEWLAEQTHELWGALKPQPQIVAQTLEASDVTDLRRAAELLLHADARSPVAQFRALAEFYERFLTPDMHALDTGTTGSLERLAGSSDDDLAALGLASLHLANGERADVRAFLADRLRTLGPREHRVRLRWSTILGFSGDRFRLDGDTRRAIAAYQKALEIRPDHAALHHSLGLTYAAGGDPQRALEAYGRSLELEPDQALVWVNAGIALNAAGDQATAQDAFSRAIEVNPWEPLGYFNLANAHLRAGRSGDAVPLYEKAAQLDASNANAHFYLARALILTGEYERARNAVRNGLHFEPSNSTARQMLADLEVALEGR